MTSITNNHTTALTLAGGPTLPPGVATNVDNWDDIKDNAVHKAWQKAGILKVGKAVSAEDEKAELQQKLDEAGVKYDKRAGVEKLRDLLVEHEKAAGNDGQAGGA